MTKYVLNPLSPNLNFVQKHSFPSYMRCNCIVVPFSCHTNTLALLTTAPPSCINRNIQTRGTDTLLTMVLYTKHGLTLSTAEGIATAIALFYNTDSLKLTVRALKSVAGLLKCFHLQNKLASAGRHVPPLVSLHSMVAMSFLKTDDVIRS